MDRAALADFLRLRRDALAPADVGLAAGARRRTAGLRREEVASLVGMSADYYARLEQQRSPQPSEQMLAALARALRLTLDERDHLFVLAGHTAPRRALRSEHVAPPLLRVLDRLDDTPALVIDELGATLAANRLAILLLGDHSALSGFERSMVFRWFTDPAEREHYVADQRDRQARSQVAQLRAAVTSARDDRAAELVAELRRRSPEFVELWDRHEVLRRFEDRKTLVHPEVGEVEVDCQALFTEDQSQTLLVLTARAGTDAAEKLRLLQVIGEQQFAG